MEMEYLHETNHDMNMNNYKDLNGLNFRNEKYEELQ